jgi:hypothetical protein
MKTTKSAWREVSGDRFEEEAPAGRHIWFSDGTLGYARPLADGETAEQAQTDFCRAYADQRQDGESDEDFEARIVEEFRVYQDGEWAE